ncbi:MAG: 1-acyl-sn-glycerol-3-phosphate acyltransferase [Bacteroidetes bacterium]|nr:MAG: 1-acyl-sn-glycerol-3-phosphate acyltransferase [Bacteroidota bacterium]TAG86696.1 MAG: 1-acyl-sn-glycerol-3-phosphate acyltransferase [Bacteroidota bacterium]
MIILRRIYSIWGMIAFGLPFLLFLPFFHLFAKKEKWHIYVSILNRWWANIFWFLVIMPYKIEYKNKKKIKNPAVYCANHTSFLDILTMGSIVKGDYMFIGKEELADIPLFGSMFKKLHITVNRESKISAYRTLLKSKEAIDKNQSIVMFPEGGIISNNPPELTPFKEGAFRLAIEKQVPIVPVTIFYNWVILPDDEKYLLNWHRGRAIVHEPVSTLGMTNQDVEMLKEKIFQIIRQPLEKDIEKLSKIKA